MAAAGSGGGSAANEADGVFATRNTANTAKNEALNCEAKDVIGAYPESNAASTVINRNCVGHKCQV
jgi:hypothetical protein